jgi:hypothetical protein
VCLCVWSKKPGRCEWLQPLGTKTTLKCAYDCRRQAKASGQIGSPRPVQARQPLADRLQRRIPTPLPAHTLSVPVLYSGKNPHPPVLQREHLGAVGSPHEVGGLGDNRLIDGIRIPLPFHERHVEAWKPLVAQLLQPVYLSTPSSCDNASRPTASLVAPASASTFVVSSIISSFCLVTVVYRISVSRKTRAASFATYRLIWERSVEMVDVPTASFEGVSKENVSALCDRFGLSYRGLVYNNKIVFYFYQTLQ